MATKTDLKSLLNELVTQKLLSECSKEYLLENFDHDLLEQGDEDADEIDIAYIESFAMALAFRSTKAYCHLQKKFRSILPDYEVICQWNIRTDGMPGINII